MAVKINATTWVVVGTMSDGPTSDDPTQITISAGPGLNISLTSPKKVPTVIFCRKRTIGNCKARCRRSRLISWNDADGADGHVVQDYFQMGAG
jgi:hypothetical protein